MAAVTFGFWVIKVLATTLGETGGDWVTMSLEPRLSDRQRDLRRNLLSLVWSQVKASRFHPALFWATIVATTTLGTTMADFADRSLGIGYPGGVAIVAFASRSEPSDLAMVRRNGVRCEHQHAEGGMVLLVHDPVFPDARDGLGDWLAGSDRGGLGLGYEYGALVFGLGLAVVAGLYFWTKVSRTVLFWAAFILTRPLGATLGDLLDKPVASGGLNFSRWVASLVLLGSIVACIAFIPQRAAKKGDAV